MGTVLGKFGQELPRIAKDAQNIFHQFCGIIGSIFSDMGGITGGTNQNGTSSSKIWPS